MLAKAVLLAALVTVVSAGMCDNMTVGDESKPDRSSQRYVQSLVPPVKTRFAALVAASHCRQEDNRYSYELLLSKVSGSGRAILERAAADGLQEGRSAATEVREVEGNKCGGAVDRLRSADDRLLLLAEHLRG